MLLNVYSGPGTTSVWIDDLEVAGHVPPARPTFGGEGTACSCGGSAIGTRRGPIRWRRCDFHRFKRKGAWRRSIRRRSRPCRLCAARETARGETGPFGVASQRPADVAARDAISRRTVGRVEEDWIQRSLAATIAGAGNIGRGRSAGFVVDLSAAANRRNRDGGIGPEFDSVLAWDLGSGLTAADLEGIQSWADRVRAVDRRGNRPMICCPRTDLYGYSRAANVLLIDRRPLGTSLEMADYAAWVRRQPLLASPGTPIWTTVQTQPNETVRQQLAALEPGVPPPSCVAAEQIRLLAYLAVASGSRGLMFLSDSPLDAADPETKQRATALELLNLELDVIEPWVAAGSCAPSAESGTREVFGAVLRADQARLLLPIWTAPQSQYVVPQSAANDVTLLVPGVPETSNAYELTPGGVRRLRDPLRVAGGMRVNLLEFGLCSQVLLAHDPSIINAVRGKAEEIGRRAAELHRDLAAYELSLVERNAGQLNARTPNPAAPGWLDAARRDLQTCNRQLAGGDSPSATLDAERATRALRLVERGYWDRAVKELASRRHEPGGREFRHTAVALATVRSINKIQPRSKPDRRRRFRRHGHDDPGRLAICPQSAGREFAAADGSERASGG